MKRSENISAWASILMWVLPVALIVPNVALSLLGHMPFWASAANVMLPLGVYLLVLALWRNVGRSALCLFPFMFLAAFQIVLLFLYGDGSIIGVDMFLNVATTNSSEALELLGNLLPAIATVLVLYLPSIITAIVLWVKRQVARPSLRRIAKYAGLSLTLFGFIALGVAKFKVPYYKIDEDFYPVNVMCNLGSAVHRAQASANYANSASGFRFDAVSQRPDSLREVYVAIIGETSRADNWQLFGYPRFTTPRLCAMPDSTLVACPMVISESNTTHKSVPLLMSTLSSNEFSDSINSTKSFITAFNEAGFQTAFISLQARNHSYIDFFASEADTTLFLREPVAGQLVKEMFDVDILPYVDSILNQRATKQLIVLHMYGSHFNYSDRYRREDAFFIPDLTEEATAQNRQRLLNAYDNTIRQTDEVISQIIARLDSVGCAGAVLYTSDHGEDIYDDARGRFLHASPTPTFSQLHVPMVLYFTPSLRQLEPDKWDSAKVNSRMRISSSASFAPTLLDVADIHTRRLDPRLSIVSHYFHPVTEPLFLNDRNRAETLREAGFHKLDAEKYSRMIRNN